MTDETHILLAHGNGGRLMRELIDAVFVPHLANPYLDVQADAATVPHGDGRLMLTTDAFTVQPLEFPGGDIGTLAVHGTVNDLAVAGAVPLYMTLSMVIEEGFEVSRLERIAMSIGRAARESGVAVVAGDTKVVRRGEGGYAYAPVSPVLAECCDALERLYRERPVAVVNLIASTRSKLQSFADAFRLKGEPE